MDISTYLRPLLKWWWLLLIATLIAAISSYLVTSQQPPIFQSRATLVSGRAVYEANPTGNDLYLNQQLAAFYADMARREPVRNATLQALGLQQLPDYTATVLPDSQLIEIVVSDTDPGRAQAVANELANQLVKKTPINDQDSARQAFIQEQLNQLQNRINETQDEIAAKQNEMAKLVSARQISDIQQEIAALEEKLSSFRLNYSNLLSNSDRGATNTLTVLETADRPRIPIGPNRLITVLLSGAIALALAGAAAYLMEYLDDTVKTPDEITRLLDIPVIGFVSEMGKDLLDDGSIAKQPRSVVAEEFRGLRTDLEFAGVDRPLKTILVTSSGVSAGKTTIAINLAIVMAQSGKRVILVDADLRRPMVHKYLDLPNQKGMCDVFRGGLDVYNAAIHWKEGNIFVIPSGGVPPNPTELLGSKKMDQILDSLERTADVVILDAPPLMVTDLTILASKVDGILLVVRHGFTRRPEIVSAVKRLTRADVRVVGSVLNRIPRAGMEYGGLYRYYNTYLEEGEKPAPGKNGKSKLAGLLGRREKTVDVEPKKSG